MIEKSKIGTFGEAQYRIPIPTKILRSHLSLPSGDVTGMRTEIARLTVL